MAAFWWSDSSNNEEHKNKNYSYYGRSNFDDVVDSFSLILKKN